jgi:hypothetical protein
LVWKELEKLMCAVLSIFSYTSAWLFSGPVKTGENSNKKSPKEKIFWRSINELSTGKQTADQIKDAE